MRSLLDTSKVYMKIMVVWCHGAGVGEQKGEIEVLWRGYEVDLGKGRRNMWEECGGEEPCGVQR